MRRGAVFKGESLPALPPPSGVSPLAPPRAREAPAGAKPRPPPRVAAAPAGTRGATAGGFPGSALPGAVGERTSSLCPLRRRGHLCSAAGQAGTERGGRARTASVRAGECCERARVCECERAGEAAEATARWLGAGRAGIARFSPAGAGDLQAIPLYFRRELTSPAPQPRATPLTASPTPTSRRRPSPTTQPLAIN